jgi:hypothetical protein
MLRSVSEGQRFVKEGDRLVHVAGQLSDELRLIYYDSSKPLDAMMMREYINLIRELYRLPAESLEVTNPLFSKLLFTLSPRLLDDIAKVSAVHQKQSEFMLGRLASKQHFFFGTSLATLILVGSLLLQPLVERLKETALKMRQEKAFADNVINTTQHASVNYRFGC